ncbi:MAG: PDZ domain-containing protein [Flavobacteriales bacterium]|nr:PDZ domain-containing protein [Flavobacteriales bacterium]
MKIQFIPIFLSFACMAQELPRKGSLGIEMKQEENKIEVLRVIDNTTASEIGLQVSDMIIQTNGNDVGTVPEFVESIGGWRENDPLTVLVERNNKSLTLEGKIKGKPLETSLYGEVIYGSVNYDGGQLRSILELPHGVENPPMVYMLPGVGCGSFDYAFKPKSPIKLLVEELVKNKIAVFRVEKPGMGDSRGTQECLEMNFDYEIQAFRAGLQKLKELNGFDKDNIYLYGNSLGVVSAPFIAEGHDISGIIAWGGVTSSWYEYELKRYRDQDIRLGGEYEEMERTFRAYQSFLYDFYVQKMTLETLKAKAEYDTLIPHFFKDELFHGIQHYTYFQNINDKDVMTAYKKANCPILALAGELDVHTVDTHWAKQLADLGNYYGNESSYRIISKTNHHYSQLKSMEEYNKMRAEGTLDSKYMAENFNYYIPEIVANWIHERKTIATQ